MTFVAVLSLRAEGLKNLPVCWLCSDVGDARNGLAPPRWKLVLIRYEKRSWQITSPSPY